MRELRRGRAPRRGRLARYERAEHSGPTFTVVEMVFVDLTPFLRPPVEPETGSDHRDGAGGMLLSELLDDSTLEFIEKRRGISPK